MTRKKKVKISSLKFRRSLKSTIHIVLMVAMLSFVVIPNLAATAFAADEYDALRGKWLDYLTGGTAFNTSDPEIVARTQVITDTASGYWESLNKDANRTYLWNDLDQACSPSGSYSRLKALALAYSTKGSSLYHDTTLKSDIINALDWLYTNKYNENTIYNNSCGWDWEIGIPQTLNDTVVLMYNDLTLTQITNYMRPIDKFDGDPTVFNLAYPTEATGANRTDKAFAMLLRGVLGKQSDKITTSRDALSQVYLYVKSGDGFYEDGSFVQHTKIAYTGSYGGVLLKSLTNALYLFNGSSWAVTDPNISNVYKWVTDSFEPLVYKGGMFDSVYGRSISRQASNPMRGPVSSVLLLSQIAPASYVTSYQRMLKNWFTSDPDWSIYNTAIFDILKIKDIMNNPSILPKDDLNKTQIFTGMDRAVQLQAGYAFDLSMFSNRISAFEYGNGENIKGWFTGVGMTSLHNSDLNQFSGNYWPTVNMFRLPGTTTDGSGSGNTPINWKVYLNAKTWVGGSVVGVTNASVGMEFSLSQDTGSTLQGKKSWFMLGNKIIALGAGISSTDNANVETIVENRKLNDSGSNALTVNGTVKPNGLGWSESMSGVQWAHLAGSVAGSDIGYYFPGTTTLKGLRESRTGAWSDINTGQSPILYTNNFLSLAINHGTNPANASYAYAILPNRSTTDMASYASAPDFSILENSADAQAVKDTTLNVVGANFWKDNSKTVSVNGTPFLTSNKKASVTTLESTNQIEIGVSDPTQSNNGTIDIEINRSATGPISLDPGITVTQFSPTIKMTVNVSGAIGKTFNAKFNLAPVIIPPDADAYVRDGSYSNTNYGTSEVLTVKNDGTGYNRSSFLKFNLSSIPTAVTNAKIQLVPNYTGIPGIKNQANLVSDNSWTETGITWNNKPASSTVLGSWTLPPIGTPVKFDVTNQVNNALTSDKLLSIQVSSPTNQGSTGDVNYASKESGTSQPVILIIPNSPTLTSANVNDAQVTLNWPFVSGATGFKVQYGTAPGIYSNTILVNASGANSNTITGLTNGTAYYFVVSATNDAGESTISNELSAVPNKLPNPHVSLGAVGDAYVRDGSYSNTNFGTTSTMVVKNEATGYDRKSFVKYDLSSITGTVQSAKIMMVPASEGKAGIINQANLVSDNTWEETSITWNNQPSADTLLSSFTVPAVGTVVQIDVTSQVQAALDGNKKLSIVISSPTNQGSTGDVSYATKENGDVSYRPVIVIN